jgi:hypothetical protein
MTEDWEETEKSSDRHCGHVPVNFFLFLLHGPNT